MNLERFVHLSVNWCFLASIGSFQGLPAELSEVILLSQRLALTYSTIPQPLLQAFFTFFSSFFALCIHHPVFCSVSGDVLTFLPPFPRKKQPPHKTCSGCYLGIQFFSSCFISRRVSQTAAASIGSAAISPMGLGPSTLSVSYTHLTLPTMITV